jgi:cell division protein FtsW
MTREEKQEKARVNRIMSKGPIDLPFALLVLLLTAIGVLMVFSASFARAFYESSDPTAMSGLSIFLRQLVFAVAGVIVMFAVSRIDYHWWRRWAVPLLGLAIILLVLVIIPHNPIAYTSGGATRWLNLGFTTFQPSEVAKFAVILYFAATISVKKDKMRTFQDGIFPYFLILGIISVLMLKEPHLSGTILILCIGACMMFVGGISPAMVGLGVSGGVVGIAILLSGVLPYGQSRILQWKDPWAYAADEGYQTVQSLLAIGSGGLAGLGFGKGRQKLLYLPEEHNDMIFSIVCEELGFIGAALILALFCFLVLRGFWIALHARDRFGALLVVGITTMIAMQTFLNVAVVTNFVPNTGISLPFFSYGGTALLIQLFEMGIVLSVSRQMPGTKSG